MIFGGAFAEYSMTGYTTNDFMTGRDHMGGGGGYSGGYTSGGYNMDYNNGGFMSGGYNRGNSDHGYNSGLQQGDSIGDFGEINHGNAYSASNIEALSESFGGPSDHYGGGESNDHSEESGIYHTHGHSTPVSKHVEITKPVAVPVYKQIHVPVQKPFHVQIPHPVLVPVPQPYPIHVPVAQPVAVPIVKEISIPVEKVVPYPVEKKVPYPVEKHVPYPVEKHVTIPVHQPIPYKVPIVKTIFHKVKSHGWN